MEYIKSIDELQENEHIYLADIYSDGSCLRYDVRICNVSYIDGVSGRVFVHNYDFKYPDRNFGFYYLIQAFPAYEMAKEVCDFITNSNNVCIGCRYDEILSKSECKCKNCKYLISGYCDKIKEFTGLEVSQNTIFPCKYFESNGKYDVSSVSEYYETIINCEYPNYVGSKCPKRDYQIVNKPHFMSADYSRKIQTNPLNRENIKIRLNIFDKKSYFIKDVSLGDFYNFNFIEDGKIKFDYLFSYLGDNSRIYLSKKRPNDIYFKHKKTDFNKYLCGNDLEILPELL